MEFQCLAQRTLLRFSRQEGAPPVKLGVAGSSEIRVDDDNHLLAAMRLEGQAPLDLP